MSAIFLALKVKMAKAHIQRVPSFETAPASQSAVSFLDIIRLYERGADVSHLLGTINSPPKIRSVILAATRKKYDKLLVAAAKRYVSLAPDEAQSTLNAVDAITSKSGNELKRFARATLITQLKQGTIPLINLARRQTQIGSYDAAFENLGKALSFNEEHQKALQAIFKLSQKSGDHQRALILYKQLLLQVGKDTRLLLRIAHSLQRCDQTRAACRYIDEICDKHLESFRDFDIHDVRIFLNAGRLKEAKLAARFSARNNANAPISSPSPGKVKENSSNTFPSQWKNELTEHLSSVWKYGKSEWNRRATAGHCMSRDIVNRLLYTATQGFRRNFTADILSYVDLESMSKTRGKLYAMSKSDAPLVLLSAHVGPAMVAAEQALQSVPNLRYLSAQSSYGLLRGGDNYLNTSLDRRLRALDVYNAITNFGAFYTSVDFVGKYDAPKQKTMLLGKQAYLPIAVPEIVFKTNAQAYWYVALWRDNKIVFELDKGPEVKDYACQTDWINAWLAFYTERLERALLAAPENYRFSLQNIDLSA